jgi:hypothetical protein
VACAAEGRILPGDWIIETELAAQLGVSRTLVHEALSGAFFFNGRKYSISSKWMQSTN